MNNFKITHPKLKGIKGKLHVWVDSFENWRDSKLQLEETRVEFRRAINDLNEFTRYKEQFLKILDFENFRKKIQND